MALDLPTPPNIMELAPPPAFSISFLFMIVAQCQQQMTMGSTKLGEETQQRRGLLHDLAGELCAGVVQALGKVGVVHQAGLVDLRVRLYR